MDCKDCPARGNICGAWATDDESCKVFLENLEMYVTVRKNTDNE